MNATATRCFLLVLTVGLAIPTSRGDWPAYKHDAQRSGVTEESLSFPLTPAWTYVCSQPPAPAWPDPFRLVNRMDFDYAPALAIAGGLVCFGSSADDTVRALDAKTGQEKWHFITGGPVRFAPQIDNGKVFFASDDGLVYCLDAGSGKLVWKFRVVPYDEQMIGNHRMMSRWPIRTGVLVADGVLYCVAGMWPAEGVFVYALEANTGKALWCNDTVGGTPQGALLASRDVLLVPNGNARTTPLNRHTGALMQWPSPRGASGCAPGWLAGSYVKIEADPRTGKPAWTDYLGGLSGRGGTWVTLDGDNEYSFAMHRDGVLRIEPYYLTNGLAGRAWDAPQLSIESSWGPNQIHERGKASAIVDKGKLYARKAYGLALAGDTLLLGHEGLVVAQNAAPLMAELRFGVAGDELAVFAVVPDRRVGQAPTPWEGSCVEVFGSMPGASRIGQVFLVPGASNAPARAYRALDGKIVPTSEIRLQSATTGTGYALSALIPLSLLALEKTTSPRSGASGPLPPGGDGATNLNYRLEAQVTVPEPDGTVQRDTLFGSPAAYRDNAKFGAFQLKPQSALSSPAQAQAALAAVQTNTIKLRGSGEIWRANVRGEARELAVADGQLFVSTSEGVITCFAPGGGEGGRGQGFRSPNPDKSKIPPSAGQVQNLSRVSRDPKSKIINPLRQAKLPTPTDQEAGLLRQIRDARMDRGYALVVGDTQGRLSEILAAHTQLGVICMEPDLKRAAKLRERLLATTTWYGSRIHVQTVERLDALPFAQYFANAVIVAGANGGPGAPPARSATLSVAGGRTASAPANDAQPGTRATERTGHQTEAPAGGPGAPRAASESGLSGKELYRVLRPCGGILLFPGLTLADAGKLVAETGASEAEIRAPQQPAPTTDDRLVAAKRSEDGTLNTDNRTFIQRFAGLNTAPAIVRGKLPGALDWDAPEFPKFKADRRVKWPLRPLWFGGPSTRQAQDFGESASTGPVVANGRYFMVSEHALTAVDAYNGVILWSRPIPQLSSNIRDVDGALYRVSDPTTARVHWRQARTLRVSDDNVYLALEPAYFQGKGEGLIQLDAHTGEQQKICGPFNAPTSILLQAAQTWPLDVSSNQSGTVAMESTAQGVVLTLTTQDPSVTPLDAWELFFDFRPVEARYGLYERGAFHIRVAPARGPALPAIVPGATAGGSGTGAATPASWSPVTAWSSRDPSVAVLGSEVAAGGPGAPPARSATLSVAGGRAASAPADDLSSVSRDAQPGTRAAERTGHQAALSLAGESGPGSMPGSSAATAGTTPLYPQFDVSGTRDTNGTKTTLVLPWPALERWLGVKPTSFDFAATLNAHDGGRDSPIVRRHLFGNWTADGINNGWARILLDDLSRSQRDPAMRDAWQAGGGTSAKSATGDTNPPAIMAKNFKDGFNWGPTFYAAPKIDESVQEAPGSHPLTGEPVPKIYGIAPVCGAAYLSATLMSQAGGLYDLADNSGRRSPYHGVKTGCTTPQLAALGLFFISEEWGHCVCNYPFRGSLALAPAERRLSEDWAQFYDRDVDTRVRQAFVNLGAPGDRRDEKGDLWLGFPRSNALQKPEDYPNADHPLPYPLGMRDAQVGLWPRRPIRSVLWLPLEVECSVVAPLHGASSDFGPYRFSADRVQIQGTDRPWIYGSGYRGIRKATLKLDFFKPLVSLPAVATPQALQAGLPAAPAAMTVDGKLGEAAWGDAFQSTNGVAPLLPYTGTRVAFRHDSSNLYVGLQRPPMVYRPTRAEKSLQGGFMAEPRPWRTTTNSGPDKISNGDNWWRLIVGSADGKRAAHFTVTPAGVRADALLDEARTNLDLAWNPEWQCAVQTNDQGWAVEMAIPWSALAEAGLPAIAPGATAGVSSNRLAVNFLMFDPGLGAEALTYLGIGGYDRCSNFTPVGIGAPAAIPPRLFTLRLHFAEPDETAQPGQRVFDVLLQGRQVLTGFDIVKEAGGARTAVVKEFPHVSAADALTVEFKPCAAALAPPAAEPDGATVPVLSGLEMVDETWERPKM